MDIKMLSTKRASEDGFYVKEFEKDKTYFGVADTAACALVNSGFAERLSPMTGFEVIAEMNKRLMEIFGHNSEEDLPDRHGANND